MEENIRTIEVNGHKFEVDLRTAKKIESYRVGDKVKLLTKQYDGYKVYPGAIVGIDSFKNLPTIIVAYIPSLFGNDGKLEFAYLNSQSKDTEICPMSEDDVLPNRETIVKYFNSSIKTLQAQIEAIESRRDYFMRQYGTAFGVGAAEVSAATQPSSEPF